MCLLIGSKFWGVIDPSLGIPCIESIIDSGFIYAKIKSLQYGVQVV